jgi:ornithine cyclodeaminase/alanine dehydrogenase-like protein (mu-crystallin family)
MTAIPTALYLIRGAIESIGLPMARIIELVESSLVEKAHGRADAGQAMGVAVEDIATASEIYALAKAQNIGVVLAL